MSEDGNAFSQFRAADYRKLARQNLFGFEESACGEKNAVGGLEGREAISKVHNFNRLEVEKVGCQSRSHRHHLKNLRFLCCCSAAIAVRAV
ncbi:hypothetical protein [Roseibium sp. TrichSKD4]|uniref:hypothetical protein n=1 Tax=Roseibium sp. TrichSKD4 TaxID=744980 RepID=UPI001112936F|nr:hypothetical protein [Roseibium sp. TrichSKD4]